MTRPATQPLDLPRLVMRRAAVVGVLTLLVAALVGLLRANHNIHDEVDAAMTLARVMARLGSLPQADDATALAALQEVAADNELRHLELRVRARSGRLLLAPGTPPTDPWWLAALMRGHREWLAPPEHRVVEWAVQRPSGAVWTVSLAATPDSERREALADLGGMLSVLLLGLLGLLAAMHWNVRRAFRPLADLLRAIHGIETPTARGMHPLPPMPIRELEAIAHALRQLSTALDDAEAQRRTLSQKVLTLQEDERTHLARELHDEFGQRLTALRFDAAWLARQVAHDPALTQVVAGMSARCAEVQDDIRHLLTRLRPLGPTEPGRTHAPLPTDDLLQMLRALADSWHSPAGRPTEPSSAHAHIHLQVSDSDSDSDSESDARTAHTRASTDGAIATLPRPLALTVYRLTQEALTNVARHAQASEVNIVLRWVKNRQGDTVQLQWSVTDNGIGLPDASAAQRRGNGLGGMQERVWALGGEWQMGAGIDGQGWRVAAVLPLSAALDIASPRPQQKDTA